MEEVRPAEQFADERSFGEKVKDSLLGVGVERPPVSTGPIEESHKGKIGICFSGGGIRSASFCLGALQVLKEKGIFEKAAYLSAVSGGSYIAGSDAMVRTSSHASLLQSPDVYSRGSPEERYLRNRSSYLAPGFWGKVRLMRRVFSGVAVNVGLIALAVYVVARPLGWAYREWLYLGLDPGPTRVRPAQEVWLIVGGAAGLGALVALVDLLWRPSEKIRRFVEAWTTRLWLVAVLLFILLVAFPYSIEFVRDVLSGAGEAVGVAEAGDTAKTQGSRLLQLIAGVSGSGLAVAAFRVVVKERSRLATVAGALLGHLLIVVLFLWFLNDATFEGFDREWLRWSLLTGVFVVGYVTADLTKWSMHPFYKRRLSAAFATSRITDDPGAAEIDPDRLVQLSQSQPGEGPTLIICAAANVSDEGATPPGRGAATFWFTADTMGGPEVGKVSTEEFEQLLGPAARDITLPAAIAMSGAAISPSMGKATRAPLRFLMALANVRLGVWLPNPDRIQLLRSIPQSGLIPGIRRYLLIRPRPRYLLKEMLGLHQLTDKFLYVTDGGHYENLGLVELLRRGCTEIYCFDASGDQPHTFFTLGEAISIARADLGVEIDISVNPDLLPDEQSGLAPASHAVGVITYADGAKGKLTYVKAAVTSAEPWDVKAYKERDTQFPSHPTLDQLFDEQQFESYRALGEWAARRVV